MAKPLLFGSTQGDTEAMESYPSLFADNDPSYIPGYAERVRANEIASNPNLSTAAREAALRSIGATPGPLPLETMWIRISGVNGERSANADISAAEYKRRGYRLATVDDLKVLSDGVVPPAAHIDADGTIRREDVALFVIDAKRAQALERERLEWNKNYHTMQNSEGRSGGVVITSTEESRETILLSN